MDFTSLGGAQTPAPVEVAPAAPGISLNLEKNTMLDLAKTAPSLTHVDLCAGWDASACGPDADLDISVFLCNAAGKITKNTDVIFFNNKETTGIKLNGDNRTGSGDGDDETITIDLTAVEASVNKIVCCVTIADAAKNQQVFGMVNNAYVRLVDKSNDAELAKFDLKTDGSSATAMLFAELVRNGGSWVFHTIGEGKCADLNGVAALFS